MKINIWDNYLSNSGTSSLVVRGYIVLLAILGVLHGGVNWKIWTIAAVLDVLQYAYLTAYYEVKGILSERGRAFDQTYLHILPSVVCFYGKIVALLGVLL